MREFPVLLLKPSGSELNRGMALFNNQPPQNEGVFKPPIGGLLWWVLRLQAKVLA